MSVFYRDYRTVDGLQIPFTIESGVASAKAMDKLRIEKVSLNAPLPDRMFAQPGALRNMPRNAVTVDMRGPPQQNPTTPPPAAARH